MYFFRLFILASLMLLMSCGGGGGSSGSSGGSGGSGGSDSKTSITVNPSSLEFTANINSSSTAKPVNVSFKGDGMLVGYPSGSADPGWVTVSISESYSSPVTVNVQVHAFGMAAGTYHTTLRFVTGKEDGSNITYKDVPVTMTVEEGASISTDSINFTSLESISSENKTFTISTKAATDWSVSAQYSGTEANWLNLSQTNGSLAANGSTNISVSVKGLKQGEHTAVILLKNKSGATIDTVNVSYHVNSGVSISESLTKNLTEKASIEELQWSIPLQTTYDVTKGSTINWTLSSNKDWLKVISNSGNLSSSQNLQLELDADKLLVLENGNQPVVLTLTFDNTNIQNITIPLTLMLNLDAKLTVAGYLGFTLDGNSTDSSLQKTIQVGLNVGSAFSKNITWHVAVQSDWLKAVNTSGDTTTQNLLTLKVDKDYLTTFKGNIDSAFISIIPDDSRFKHYAELAALQIYIPQITTVSPYVGFTNQSGPIVISGNNFSLKSEWQIDFNGILVDATVVDNNTLRVNYPPISTPQTIKLKIPNPLDLNRSQANLVIKDAPNYITAKIDMDKTFERMTLDAERQAIILSGQPANQITRLKYDNLTWSTDIFPMAYSQNAELSVDGREILLAVGNQNSIDNLIQLNADDLSIKKVSLLSSEPYGEFSIILPMANSKTLIMDKVLWNDALLFPTMEIIGAPRDLSGWIKAFILRDRSRFIVVGDRNIYSFDANGSTYTQRQVILSSGSQRLSMSTTGSRLLADTTLYDSDFNLLGSLNPIVNNLQLVAVTPDGTYAYVLYYLDPYYSWSQNTLALKRYNISDSRGPYAADSDNLDYAIDSNDYPVDMKVSDDGQALFILTNNRSSDLSSVYVFPLTK